MLWTVVHAAYNGDDALLSSWKERASQELTGLWAARRGPYRVIYEIDEKQGAIVVLRIDHRADVYRPR